MPTPLPPLPPARPGADQCGFVLPQALEPTAAEQAQERSDNEILDACFLPHDEWVRRCVAAGLVQVPDLKTEVEHYMKTGRPMQIDVPAQPTVHDLPLRLRTLALGRQYENTMADIAAARKRGDGTKSHL